MTTKHTPQWDNRSRIENPSPELLAMIRLQFLESAAPELLAACRSAIGWMGDCQPGTEQAEIADKLRAAIAKAEGRA